MTEHHEKLRARLAAHPFLAGIPPNHLEVLAGCAQPLHFEAGQMIFRAGENANGFYLIEAGEVAIDDAHRAQPLTIDLLGPGEPLGWSWIFCPAVWQYDARCTRDTTALFFSAAVLNQHRDDDHSFGHELFRKMCQVMVKRLQAARGKLAGALDPAGGARKVPGNHEG